SFLTLKTLGGLKKHVLSPAKTRELVAAQVRNHADDRQIRGLKSSDVWVDGQLMRKVVVTGRRGKHVILISIAQGKVVSSSYSEFPQADVPVMVYPIYEEVERTGQILPRVPGVLRYLKSEAVRSATDPYDSLRNRQYLSNMHDFVLGATPQGQAQGY